MSCMSDMTPTLLAAIIKMVNVFLKEEKICYKIISYTLCLDSLKKLEFISRRKTDFSERGLALITGL